MKRAAMVALLIYMGCLVVGFTPAVSQADSIGDEILALDLTRVAAVTHNDFAALDKILADDFVYVHSGGRVNTKSEYIEGLRSGQMQYSAIDKKEARVRVSGDIAVINGRYTIHAKGTTEEVNMVIVYERHNGRWQQALQQSTRLPAPPQATLPAKQP